MGVAALAPLIAVSLRLAGWRGFQFCGYAADVRARASKHVFTICPRNGKPEAYRYVLRQSRHRVEGRVSQVSSYPDLNSDYLPNDFASLMRGKSLTCRPAHVFFAGPGPHFAVIDRQV